MHELDEPYEPHGRCACGKPLDENGEHDGGYGPWCADPLPSGACPPDATASTERELGRPEGETWPTPQRRGSFDSRRRATVRPRAR